MVAILQRVYSWLHTWFYNMSNIVMNKYQVKFLKHTKLVKDSLSEEQRKGEVDAVFDGYDIHENLITWALLNISTKKLKKLIETGRPQ